MRENELVDWLDWKGYCGLLTDRLTAGSKSLADICPFRADVYEFQIWPHLFNVIEYK